MDDVRVDLDRMVIVIEESGSADCSIEFGPSYREGMLRVEINNPWSGDSESGFGSSADMKMTKEQARELAAFLLKFADS
jgi:hypothetical protein